MISKNTKLTVGMSLRSDKIPERTYTVARVKPLTVVLIPTGSVEAAFREAISIVKASCTIV